MNHRSDPVYFDMHVVNREVQELRQLGYPDELIEIYQRGNSMHARPLSEAEVSGGERTLYGLGHRI